MKKKINTRKMQEKNGHRFLQLNSFLFMFLCTMGFNYKARGGERTEGWSFHFPIMPMGRVPIYSFKLIISRGGGEFRDLDLWLPSLATFFFIECIPLHGKSHLPNNIILSLPYGV